MNLFGWQGGLIMDVVNAEQARIAQEAGVINVLINYMNEWMNV